MTEYSLLIDDTGNKKDINSLYLFNLYYYYHNKGYSNLILTELTNLLVLVFTVFLLIFLGQCVDFKELINYNTKEMISISYFINLHNFWKLNPFVIICSVLFLGYVSIRLISIYASIKKFWKIRKIFKDDLEIDSKDLDTITWNEVSNKIVKYYCNPNLNSYTMALKIMTKENLIISIYDQLENLEFNKYPLSKLLEWNFIFCFINPLINENREISDDIKLDINKYQDKVNTQLKRVAIINLIFMPFLLIFIIMYMFLQYGEQFYNNPQLIMNRQWSIKASWKLRYYNELPHLFRARLENASIAAKDYDKQFPSRLYGTIAHFIMFVMGSFFMILVIITLLNENLLINLNISFNRPILWYLGIMGGIMAIVKSFANIKHVYNPEKSMKKMMEYIDIKEDWMREPRSYNVRKEIMKWFPQRLILLLEECYCLILTPYILWFVLRKESSVICEYLVNTMACHHSITGLINKNSLFISYPQIKENSKTEKSFEYFQKNYPEWGFISIIYNQDTYYPPQEQQPQTTNNSLNVISSEDNNMADILLNY
jgi:autophagy-related protein 9